MTDGLNNTVIANVMRQLARNAAVFWTQHIRPRPYEDTFRVGAVRVKISIDEHTTPDDTKPIGGAAEYEVMRSEQGIDL